MGAPQDAATGRLSGRHHFHVEVTEAGPGGRAQLRRYIAVDPRQELALEVQWDPGRSGVARPCLDPICLGPEGTRP